MEKIIIICFGFIVIKYRYSDLVEFRSTTAFLLMCKIYSITLLILMQMNMNT